MMDDRGGSCGVNIRGGLITAKVQSAQSVSLKKYLSESPSEKPIQRLTQRPKPAESLHCQHVEGFLHW